MVVLMNRPLLELSTPLQLKITFAGSTRNSTYSSTFLSKHFKSACVRVRAAAQYVCMGESTNDIRKFFGFSDPLPPLVRIWNEFNKIHETSHTTSAFP